MKKYLIIYETENTDIIYDAVNTDIIYDAVLANTPKQAVKLSFANQLSQDLDNLPDAYTYVERNGKEVHEVSEHFLEGRYFDYTQTASINGVIEVASFNHYVCVRENEYKCMKHKPFSLEKLKQLIKRHPTLTRKSSEHGYQEYFKIR